MAHLLKSRAAHLDGCGHQQFGERALPELERRRGALSTPDVHQSGRAELGECGQPGQLNYGQPFAGGAGGFLSGGGPVNGGGSLAVYNVYVLF